MDDVFSKLDQISKRPKSYSPYFEEARKASLRKFPFNIIYIILSSFVVVLAVWHKKREERWKVRLKAEKKKNNLN